MSEANLQLLLGRADICHLFYLNTETFNFCKVKRFLFKHHPLGSPNSNFVRSISSHGDRLITYHHNYCDAKFVDKQQQSLGDNKMNQGCHTLIHFQKAKLTDSLYESSGVLHDYSCHKVSFKKCPVV
jgi:hypothetical protein